MSEKTRKRIKRLFDETGWTVTELSEKSGVDRPTCSRLLTGKKKDINSGTLERLAAAFGCTVEILKR